MVLSDSHLAGEHASSSRRLLLVEDEPETNSEICNRLREAGWCVDAVFDGEAGYARACDDDFDAMIIDRMLPRLDGLSLAKRLRTENIRTPILFLTSMGSVADRVAGLDGGGDDYLVKPFSVAELVARVGALVRRGRLQVEDKTMLKIGDLSLNRLTREACRDGLSVDLLPLEFKLLECLMLNVGMIVTRNMLLERVWGFQFDPRTNIVETHICRLRTKIDAADQPSLITTVRGAGYLVASP